MPQSKITFVKKDAFLILIILTLALVFRIFYFIDYQNTDIFPTFVYSDSHAYTLWAQEIAAGDLLGEQAFMKWPFYAYFLAFLLTLFKNNFFSVYIFQMLLGALNCLLIYAIAKQLFDRRCAFLAALLAVFYGLFIFFDGLFVYTNLSLFLNSLLFLFALRLRESISGKKIFLFGLLLGLAIITQASIALFGILAVGIIVYSQRKKWSQLAVYLALFIFGLSLIIGLVSLRNYHVEKDACLVQGNLGINFYVGNNPSANGKFYLPNEISPNQKDMFRDAKVIAEASLNRRLKTSEVSKFWMSKSLKYINDHPISYLKLFAKKIAYLFCPWEYVQFLEYYLIKDQIRAFKVLFLDLRLIMPFIFLGMILGLRNLKKHYLLYLVLFTASLSIALFFVTARYRLILVPYFMIFASLGIMSFYNALIRRTNIKMFWLIFAIVLSLALAYNSWVQQIKPEEFKENFNYYLVQSMVSQGKGDYQAALKKAELAHSILPDNPQVLLNLGVVNYHLGNYLVAEDRLKQIIKRYPIYVDAYYNLGHLYNQQQRYSEALEMLRKVLLLYPEDASAHFELARTYQALGNMNKAREEFNLALKYISYTDQDSRLLIENELRQLDK